MTDRSITTSATGTASCSPETARVRLRVREGGETAADARARAETALTTVEDQLAETSAERARLVDFRLDPPTEFDDRDDPFVAVARLEAESDPDDASEVVIAGTDAGAEISEIEFGSSARTRDELYDRALEDALTRARRRAETGAGAEGVELGEVVRVETAPSEHSSSLVEDALDARPGFDFQPSPATVTVEATVTYRIS